MEPMVFRHSERERQKHDAGLVTALHGTLVKPAERTTTGWHPTCRCEYEGGGWEPVAGVVLDPFAGSGTVGLVANRLSRRAILIDLNPAYLEQQMKRNAQVPAGL